MYTPPAIKLDLSQTNMKLSHRICHVAERERCFLEVSWLKNYKTHSPFPNILYIIFFLLSLLIILFIDSLQFLLISIYSLLEKYTCLGGGRQQVWKANKVKREFRKLPFISFLMFTTTFMLLILDLKKFYNLIMMCLCRIFFVFNSVWSLLSCLFMWV